MSTIYTAPSTRTNWIVEALPLDERTNLRGLATEVDLTVNTILYEAGGKLDYVYFPEGGLVSLLVIMPGGSVAEAGFIGSEGAVGTSYDALARTSFTRGVNRRWIGTPYRHPKGTPLNGDFGR